MHLNYNKVLLGSVSVTVICNKTNGCLLSVLLVFGPLL